MEWNLLWIDHEYLYSTENIIIINNSKYNNTVLWCYKYNLPPTSVMIWLSVLVGCCAWNCSMQSREEAERGRLRWIAPTEVARPRTSTTGNSGRWGLQRNNGFFLSTTHAHWALRTSGREHPLLCTVWGCVLIGIHALLHNTAYEATFMCVHRVVLTFRMKAAKQRYVLYNFFVSVIDLCFSSLCL